MQIEGTFFNRMTRDRLVRDDLGPISRETLNLVGYHTVYSLTAKRLDTLFHERSDIVVLHPLLQHTNDHLRSSFSGHDRVSGATRHITNHASGRNQSNVSIDMHAEITAPKTIWSSQKQKTKSI